MCSTPHASRPCRPSTWLCPCLWPWRAWWAEGRERRYWTQDSTVEKLGIRLQDNPRGLLIVRDELSGWLHGLEKQGREGDRQFYLEAWNGTGSFTVDRIERGTLHIPAL